MGLDDDLETLVVRMLELSEWQPVVCETEADLTAALGTTRADLLLLGARPSFDGRAVAERVRGQAPDVPVLYVTAWHGHPQFADLKSENVLPEPFTREELTAAITSALRRDDGS